MKKTNSNNLNSKFTLVVGLVSLMILLSNFRDVLIEISLDLGFLAFNLEEFYFFIVIAISSCLYLYVLDSIALNTKIGRRKIFNVIKFLASLILGSILISPLIIGFSLLIKLLIDIDNNLSERAESILNWISMSISLLSALLSVILIVLKSRTERLKTKIEDLQEEEINELDNARNLYISEFYSQSILESFKVLEIHLYKVLTEKNVRVRRHKIQDLIEGAKKYEIITEIDLPKINEIRSMRNSSAHLDVKHNKEQAEFAIEFVKELIKRDTINNYA